jgi:hypothetical protein
MSSSIKAGLIGAAAAVVLSLLSLIPCIGCITSILGLLLYAGVGVLAAFWLTPPRTAGAGAGAGAIAGLITALAGGIVNMIITTIRFAAMGGPGAVMSQIPPEVMQQLQQSGVDLAPILASTGGVLGISAVCCVGGLAIAAGLGAAGGAIMASAKSN